MIDHVIVIVLTVMAVILLAGVGIMAVGGKAPGPGALARHRVAVLTTAFVFIAAIVSFSSYFSRVG